MNSIPIKRALISVSDKTGLMEFAQALIEQGTEIISTGGTSKALAAANISHQQIEDVTGMAEILEGRVKTLHPKIHGGILGKRESHAAEAKSLGIEWIDLVVVNFYPFAVATKNNSLALDDAIEYIDVGGPTMVRAAAKNFKWVSVVTDTQDYAAVISAIKNNAGVDYALRKKLAQKAFALTAQYDSMIYDYFAHETTTDNDSLKINFRKKMELRYGENPHQKAAAYQKNDETQGILSAKQYQGKPLSYNNILDAEAAYLCVNEFTLPTCVIVKHANPCGVASDNAIEVAFEKALAADAKSAFGGIVALNRTCTKEIATAITAIFMEVILAPNFTDEALKIFSTKPNLRILELPAAPTQEQEMRFITGGMLLQERDRLLINPAKLQVVTKAQPTTQQLTAMDFAWRVLKHIKSNAILISKDHTTIGIGAGQVSRIDAVDIAVRKSKQHSEDCILASDAFFPFRDSIDYIASTGVRAIIQPGGSLRDAEVIAACDEHTIAMVFTGNRCFKH